MEQLQKLLERFAREENMQFRILTYLDGLDITEEYPGDLDVIFMDIEMQHMDGISAGLKIREMDSKVIIIFITNSLKYAVKGYQVEALDYLVKPVTYFSLSEILKKAIKRLQNHSECFLYIKEEKGTVRVSAEDVAYIESDGHSIIYHTKQGNYRERNSIKCVEEQLQQRSFSRCNSGYLVNLAYVDRVDKNGVWVLEDVLQMSRPKKKPFMDALAAYIGRN
jgi:DNA-binding LytR/AlgR family response regulator